MSYLRSMIVTVLGVIAAAILLVFLAANTEGLTPRERKLVIHANSELDAAIAYGAQRDNEIKAAKDETAQSDQIARLAAQSALTAGQKLVTAEALQKKEHDELVRSQKENATMRPIVAIVNRWWGIGGILYGFKRLAIHLLILSAVIIALAVAAVIGATLLNITVPGLAPILGVVTGFFGRVKQRILTSISSIKHKPTMP
jgi:hypothetical protein